MSIWSRIAEAVSKLARGESLATVFDGLRTPPERSVAFTIAVIALGAKMAKADGQVTRDEVTAFREVFRIADRDEVEAAKVFNLARQDVAGFDVYAKRIADMFGPANETLCDIMDGLFHIAMADGGYHPAEDEFLIEVARIFGMEETRFRNLRARHVPDAMADPYAILGLEPGATYDEARTAWKAAVRECHPDRLAARGLPEEAVGMAERRLVDLNRAWDEITAKRSRTSAPVA